jgi:hypothetical protein
MGEGTVDRLVTRFLRGISMPIDIKKLLETPALMFSEKLTAARLKRAGVTLGEDLGLPTPNRIQIGDSLRIDSQARRNALALHLCTVLRRGLRTGANRE